MGIPGLWDVLGDGEIWSIADYAARFFEQHKRPLRFAVDEAAWRFNNLTPDQVEKIRQGEPAANPIEKTVLWRALPLMRMNIQLLFVFDGMRHPWKYKSDGSRRGGRLDYDETRLLVKVLQHLKIPYHNAPGEAEAECAKLQKMDVVDAVWSDDGDTVMFGCTTLIKQHKVGTKRIDGQVKVYMAQYILEKTMMDVDSLVLFAVLAGGDYDPKGLPGCGPQKIRKVAMSHMGVATSLRKTSQRDLPAWRVQLAEALKSCGGSVYVPPDFPNFKALEGYRNPAVSTDGQLQHLRGLRKGWYQRIDQPKLRVLLRQNFNMWTRGYLKHVAPIFLVRNLVEAVTEEQQSKNMRFDVQFKRTRKKKITEGKPDDQPQKETKITFAPLPAIEIDLSREPEGEDWSLWAGKDGSHYDPAAHVDTTILSCFLRCGLPEGAVSAPPPPARKKRKPAENPDEGGEPDAPAAAKPKRQRQTEAPMENGDTDEPIAEQTSTAPKRGRKASKLSATESEQPKPEKKGKVKENAKQVPSRFPSPERPGFRLPPRPPPGLFQKHESMVVDLMSDSEDEQSGSSLVAFQESHSLAPMSRAVSRPDQCLINETNASLAPGNPQAEPSKRRWSPRAADAIMKMIEEERRKWMSVLATSEPTTNAVPAREPPRPVSPVLPDEGARPGEAFAADKIRALRAAAFMTKPTVPAPEAVVAVPPVPPAPKPQQEVIDLT